MFRKIIRKIDEVLNFFTDFSLEQSWYLPVFGKKRRAFYHGDYGYVIENCFYPDDKTQYSYVHYLPREILFLEK